MIVSILQLMAFPFSGSVVGRGSENPNSERREPDNQGITRIHEGDALSERGRSAGARLFHAGATAARRQEVKSQPKAVKPVVKAKPAAKPVKAVAKAAKPAAKKIAAQPAAKAPAKKTMAKTAVKSPAKKAPAKTAPVKAAKPVAKNAVAAPKAKPAAKPAAKATAKPKAPPAKTVKANGLAGAALPRAMPPRPDAATLGADPARATKPSARLAQITVPSMAQSVASTAAKASYIQTMAQSVLTPPPLVAIKKDPKLANNWKSKGVEELTDAEVLAMPDEEYMNEVQMAFFRFKLAKLKQDILNSAGETTEHLREDTVIVPDPADRATIEEEHALELRTRDRERKLLKKIEQSIARIDAGDYGYCDETGEPIGVGRLLARPTATLSLEAQQRRELKQKMFGD
jgi:DnaK suppressor protein